MLKKILLTPQQRYQRRMARIERWQKPLNKTTRFKAWLNMIFVDHGFVRMIYLNAHNIDYKLIRAAQPLPYHIHQWHKQGVKKLINLRGGRDQGSWPLCREACAQCGMDYTELTLRSREAPSKETLFELIEIFETMQGQTIMHCKSGADRTGLAAALYLLYDNKKPLHEARKQLSLKFGHIRAAKTGILDAFLDLYETAYKKDGKSFIDWIKEDYDQEALQKSFQSKGLMSFFVDHILDRE